MDVVENYAAGNKNSSIIRTLRAQARSLWSPRRSSK